MYVQLNLRFMGVERGICTIDFFLKVPGYRLYVKAQVNRDIKFGVFKLVYAVLILVSKCSFTQDGFVQKMI